MKIAIAQLNYIIGDFENNFQKIAHHIEKAEQQSAELIVFSELAICGYPPHDLLEHEGFISQCQYWIERVAELTNNIAVIIGAPSINKNLSGKKLFNSAFFLNKGKIQSIHHKALLPTYDIFDEYRYFEPSNEFACISYNNYTIALTICEDLWENQPIESPFGRSQLYTVSPMEHLATENPQVIINIAGSPFSYSKSKVKTDIFCDHARKWSIPLIYVNQTGANTDLIFDGGSMVVDQKGNIVDSLKLFDEDFQIYDTANLKANYTTLSIEKSETEKIHDALVLGIRDYFIKSKLKTATLGLSGGIDSAVTLALAVDALGAENVRVLLLPSKYSSDHSVNDAVKMAKIIDIQYDIIKIQDVFELFQHTLKPIFVGKSEDLTEENLQSRIRGVLLMALSNKFGNILLNTSNKSEIATGYGTLYGDMNGGLSVLGDVYKTDVYRLARFINRNKEVIPENIITKAPSAELRFDQKDSDSLPEYDILDAILYRYIEQQLSAKAIISQGFDSAIVERVLKLVNFNEYKRFQTPPILRISQKAFGGGRRMPIVARY